MNVAVICFSVVVGLICGGLVWWVKRSLLAAAIVPIAMVAFVVLALPPAVEPVDLPPEARKREEIQPEVQDHSPEPEKLASFRPIEVAAHGYVGSDACFDCHTDQHASWLKSS